MDCVDYSMEVHQLIADSLDTEWKFLLYLISS